MTINSPATKLLLFLLTVLSAYCVASFYAPSMLCRFSATTCCGYRSSPLDITVVRN